MKCDTTWCEYYRKENDNGCNRWRERAYQYCDLHTSLTTDSDTGAEVALDCGVMLCADRKRMIGLLEKHLQVEFEPLPRGNENINITGIEKAVDAIITSMKLRQKA